MKETKIEAVVIYRYHEMANVSYHVYYESGKFRRYKFYNELPKTVKQFIKSHWDRIIKDSEEITIYRYDAVNTI